RRELAARVRFNPVYDGLHQFEFMLRISETGARIGHISKPLYHSRKQPSPTWPPGQIPPDGELQQRAVNEHLQRLGLRAQAFSTAIPRRLRITPLTRAHKPKISIIIPTKDS